MKAISVMRHMFKNDGFQVCCFFFVLYLLLFSGHIGGDSIYNFYTADSLFIDGDFELTNSLRVVNADRLTESFRAVYDNISKSEEHYSIYGLLNILVGTLFYGIGLIVSSLLPVLPRDYFLVFFFSLQNVVIGAASAYVFYKIVLKFLQDKKLAFLITLCYGATTINITYYLKSGFGEPLTNLLVLSAFYLLLIYRDSRQNWQLFLAGLICGLCVLTKLYSPLVYPAFFLLAFLTISKEAGTSSNYRILFRRYSLFVFGVSIGFAVFFVYNYARYGDIISTGYTIRDEVYTPAQDVRFNLYYAIVRFYDLLFTPGYGLVIFNPVIILAVIGIKKMIRIDRDSAIFVIICAVAFIGYFTLRYTWASAGALGPRHFVCIMSVLTLPVVFLFRNVNTEQRTRRIGYLKGFMVIGFLIQLPSIAMNYSSFERFAVKESPYHHYARVHITHYSQILGCYYLLASGAHKTVTGESLEFPVLMYGYRHDIDPEDRVEDIRRGSFVWKSLSGYDWFDNWIVHTVGKRSIPLAIRVVTFMLNLVFLYLLYILWQYRFARLSYSE